MNTAPDPAAVRKSRRQFLLLLAIFLVPVAASSLLYFVFPQHRPSGTTNYGELVTPARALPELSLRDAAGKAAGAAALQGKWTLLYLGGTDCDAACAKEIFLGRQLHTALAKDQPRLQRVYLAPDDAALQAASSRLTADHPDLLLFADTGAPSHRAADFFVPASPGALYLIDPMGFWMMVYPAKADQVQDFKGILKDLKFLLLHSHVG